MPLTTKEFMRQFIELFIKKGGKYEKKEIKLRKKNDIKYCPICGELKRIVMRGLDGFCPNCEEKIYTINSSKKDWRKDVQKTM